MIEGILIGLLQGLGIIWILVTLLLLMACTPDHWDAPISRWYPWWCPGWPLVFVALFGACALEIGEDIVRHELMGFGRWLRLKLVRDRPRIHTVPWVPGHPQLPGQVVYVLQGIGVMSGLGLPYPEIARQLADHFELKPTIARYYVAIAARLGLLRDVQVIEATVGLRH